jgi:hypothetical protein
MQSMGFSAPRQASQRFQGVYPVVFRNQTPMPDEELLTPQTMDALQEATKHYFRFGFGLPTGGFRVNSLLMDGFIKAKSRDEALQSMPVAQSATSLPSTDSHYYLVTDDEAGEDVSATNQIMAKGLDKQLEQFDPAAGKNPHHSDQLINEILYDLYGYLRQKANPLRPTRITVSSYTAEQGPGEGEGIYFLPSGGQTPLSVEVEMPHQPKRTFTAYY